MIMFLTIFGYCSANRRINIVPSEIPIKCELFDFSFLKTSTISLFEIDLKLYFFSKTFLKWYLDFPCPLRSSNITLKCFLNFLICLYQIDELPLLHEQSNPLIRFKVFIYRIINHSKIFI